MKFRIGNDIYNNPVGGALVMNQNAGTGEGAAAGSVVGSTAIISTWSAGAPSQVTSFSAAVVPANLDASSDQHVDAAVFRTSLAPVKPMSFSVVGEDVSGNAINVSADADGVINGGGVVGKINYQTGVVVLRFGTASAGPASNSVVSVSYLGIPTVSFVALKAAKADTLRYNAVAYTYIPLDASLLGLDPVRLPSDGRVPIFRPGTVAVVHHTAATPPAAVTNGQTINCARTRLARVRVVGANGQTITAGYTQDLDAGTVTFTNVTGYSQPVHVEHRVEDLVLVSEAQITGKLSFTRPLTHTFPVGSQVSSSLPMGDMKARVSELFDQGSWANVWSNDLVGDQASATYNAIDHPAQVTNRGAITERWVLKFLTSTSGQIIGEHLGVIDTFNINNGVSPMNLSAGVPYFSLPATGFGQGWSAGNVLRVNTVGAMFPVWVARVIQQGPEASSDSFAISVGGGVDAP